METAVIVLMVLVLFNFVLKLSFLHIRETMALAVVALLVVALSWPLAIEQSRTQIADWLNNQQQMLDTAVLLTIDTALHFHNVVTGADRDMGDLVIVELKRDGLCYSPVLEMLRQLRIHPHGFSKYCMGAAMTNSELPIHNFKPKLHDVERIIELMK